MTFSNLNSWKSKFLGKKIWRNALALKRKKVQGIFWENVYFAIIIFSSLWSTKIYLRFLLNFFVREIKDFYWSSLVNAVDFKDVDERALITTTLISFCDCKTLVPFSLRKKRPENGFLTLIVNYYKIVEKKKLCRSKHQ